MKKQNKTTVYVLLVVMTGIWGGIFYKFFSTVEDPKDNRPIVRKVPYPVQALLEQA